MTWTCPSKSPSSQRRRFALYISYRTMHPSLSAMVAALKVLTAINHRQQPDPADVADMCKHAGPQPGGVNLDDFACGVIQNAIKAALRVGVDPFK